MRQPLQLVGCPVAEIQRSGAARFEGISAHGYVVQMQLCGTSHHGSHRLPLERRESTTVVAQPIAERRVTYECNFDRLGHACPSIAAAQRAQQVEIVDYREGRRKTA